MQTLRSQFSDVKEVVNHIENDVVYPASKDELVSACDEMSDVPPAEKQWFLNSLPSGIYENAGEVKMMLGLT